MASLDDIDVHTEDGRAELRKACVEGNLPTIVSLIDIITSKDETMAKAREDWRAWNDWIDGRINEEDVSLIRSFDGYTGLQKLFAK